MRDARDLLAGHIVMCPYMRDARDVTTGRPGHMRDARDICGTHGTLRKLDILLGPFRPGLALYGTIWPDDPIANQAS